METQKPNGKKILKMNCNRNEQRHRLCSFLLPMLAVQAVEGAVIFIPHLHCRHGVRYSLVDQLAGECQLFLQDILLGRNLHFFLEQMAKRGLGSGGVCGEIVQEDLTARERREGQRQETVQEDHASVKEPQAQTALREDHTARVLREEHSEVIVHREEATVTVQKEEVSVTALSREDLQ